MPNIGFVVSVENTCSHRTISLDFCSNLITNSLQYMQIIFCTFCTETDAWTIGCIMCCTRGFFQFNGLLFIVQWCWWYARCFPQAFPIPCDPGQYSEAGSLSCTDCPAGTECPSVAQAPTRLCKLGRFICSLLFLAFKVQVSVSKTNSSSGWCSNLVFKT